MPFIIQTRKFFFFAKILRRQNEELRQLLQGNGYGVEDELKMEILKLLHHLNVWCEIWDYECAKRTPKLDEEFAFNNSSVFPSASVKSLMQYRNNLMTTAARE